MTVPTLVIAGDIGAVAPLAAIALDRFATIGPNWIAARAYKRAILRIGAADEGKASTVAPLTPTTLLHS